MMRQNGWDSSEKIVLMGLSSLLLLVYFLYLRAAERTRHPLLINRLQYLQSDLVSTLKQVQDVRMNKDRHCVTSFHYDENIKLRSKLSAAREEFRLLNEGLDEKESSLSQLTKDIKLIKTETNCAKDERKIILSKIEAIKAANKEYQDQLTILKDDQSNLDKELSELNQDLNKLKSKESRLDVKNDLLNQIELSKLEIKDVDNRAVKIGIDLKEINLLHEKENLKNKKLLEDDKEWKELINVLNKNGNSQSFELNAMKGQVSALQSELALKDSNFCDKSKEEDIVKECILMSDEWNLIKGDALVNESHNNKISILKSNIENAVSRKSMLQKELNNLDITSKTESSELRDMKLLMEELSNDQSMLEEKSKEVNCKIDVLTDLFNKKETELQLKLRQQSSLVNEYTMKVNDVKEILQKTLSENDSVEEEVLKIRGKISQCESELKVEITEKEKEAYESWMKCKQTDSMCNELQKELEILTSRLDITSDSSRTEISDQIEDGKCLVTEYFIQLAFQVPAVVLFNCPLCKIYHHFLDYLR